MREEQKLFIERLKEWNINRLVHEGFVIENMSGCKARWQSSATGADGSGGLILEFKKLGKNAGHLAFHRFR